MKWLKKHRAVSIIAVATILLSTVLCVVFLLSSIGNDLTDWDSRLESLNIAKPEGSFRLWVNSYPEGAEVLLGDSTCGTTPLAFDTLPADTYSLGLRLPGFVDIDTVVSLSPDAHLALPPFVFEKKLVFESIPPGAEISINGKAIGLQTPSELDWPVIDTFNLEYSMAEMDPVRISDVDLLVGTEIIPLGNFWVIVEDTVLPICRFLGYFTRRVTISTIPTGAEILSADGDSAVGLSGLPVDLPCGEWAYRLRKQGFNEQQIQLDITADSETSYSFELTRNILVTAYALGGSRVVDIGARITKADRGVRVAFFDEVTPAVLTLPGTEHRVYLEAEGYVDTSVIISAEQTSLTVGIRGIIEVVDEQPVPVEDTRNLEGRVEFYIYDKKDKEPLAAVEVIARIFSENRTVLLGVTDSSGLLALDLKPGKYEFRFLIDGYRTSREKHTVKMDETKRLEVSMKRR
jgi:hypothetical protein